ncbi:hypothetical protein RUND412_009914 [Rhizina undulata]
MAEAAVNFEDNGKIKETSACSSGVTSKAPSTILKESEKVPDLEGSVQNELEKPPDGGLKAWLQILGAHLTVFNTWYSILSFSYGIFQAYYVETLNSTPSAISWIGSLQIFLLFLLGTITGRALDAGYFRHLYIAGSSLLLVGIFTTSCATKYWQLLLSQGLCLGIANGMLFCPTLALASTYFQKRRSLALSMVASGSATGGIVIPVMVQQLLPKIGFGWTVRAVGFVTLFNICVAFSVLRPRLKPRKLGPLVEWAAFKEASYSLFAIGMFLTFWGIYFAFYYVSSYSSDVLKLDQTISFNMLIIMNAVGLIGRLIPGFLADKYFGPLNLLVPITTIVGVCFFGWMKVHSYAGLIIWSCFYGFFAAGIQSLFPATLTSLTTDLSKAGTRMGMIFSIVSFASLTGTPIGGALVQKAGGNYWSAQTFAGIVVLLGSIILAASRIAKTGLNVMARC